MIIHIYPKQLLCLSTNLFDDPITSTASDFEVVFSSSSSSDHWSQADRAKCAGGVLAGIIIGGLVALVIIVGGVVLCLRCRKRQKQDNVQLSAFDTGHSFPWQQTVPVLKPSTSTGDLELADTALPPGELMMLANYKRRTFRPQRQSSYLLHIEIMQ